MATTKRRYVVATFLPACAALALLISSIATTSWVESELRDTGGMAKTSYINYGLFSGTVLRYMGSEMTFRLTMTCILEENKCLLSCQLDSKARETEAELLISNGGIKVNIDGCIQMNKAVSVNAGLAGNSSNGDISEARFVNAGLWISTILFLIVAMLASVTAAIFAVVNTTSNPIEPIASVFGLYIWNTSAAISTLMVLILWGIQFAIALSENVAYSETIDGTFKSSGLAVLGFSYWLLIVVVFLHAMNVVVLGFRDYIIAREPPPILPSPSENPDGVIFLY